MTDTKVRRDAKLKSLPLDRQVEVARILEETGISQESLARLQEIGIAVRGLATLSRFHAWYHDPLQRARREMEAAGSVTEFALAQMKRQAPALDQEELYRHGQALFAQLAITMRDPKAWLMTQTIQRDRERVALKTQEVELAERKFQRDTCELFLKWAEDQRAREIVASGVTHGEKIERLGQVIFGELWADPEPAAAPAPSST